MTWRFALRAFFGGGVTEKLGHTLSESSPRGVPKPDARDMPFGKTSIRALEAAQERAGNSTILFLHILWGLATDRENSVSELLNLKGVTVKQIEDAIQDLQ
jgi:hypothetical protein